MNKKYINPELVKIAKSQDVLDILLKDGVPLVKKNREYRHRIHDSLVVSENKGFFWFSRGRGSKSPIDYYMWVEDMDFQDACYRVLDAMNYDYDNSDVFVQRESEESYEKKPFMLPARASDNKRAFAYLVKTRGLDPGLIRNLMNQGLIYQSDKYSNVVFVGKDYSGNIVSAFKRKAITARKGEWTKGDEYGSQKEFRFRIENSKSTMLNVFESEIDLLSYLSMQVPEARKENYISLGGVSIKALRRFLENRDVKSINVCTDNDEAGHKVAETIAAAFGEDYYVTRESPILKDFNEDLVSGIEYVKNKKELKLEVDEEFKL